MLPPGILERSESRRQSLHLPRTPPSSLLLLRRFTEQLTRAENGFISTAETSSEFEHNRTLCAGCVSTQSSVLDMIAQKNYESPLSAQMSPQEVVRFDHCGLSAYRVQTDEQCSSEKAGSTQVVAGTQYGQTVSRLARFALSLPSPTLVLSRYRCNLWQAFSYSDKSSDCEGTRSLNH